MILSEDVDISLTPILEGFLLDISEFRLKSKLKVSDYWAQSQPGVKEILGSIEEVLSLSQKMENFL